jgi:pyruvate dehydrogenase E2 component (dihydrolipoamide acetyltransferase)
VITPVVMPQLGLEVSEGIVTQLFVQIGDRVEREQPLVELETDKAITDVVAPSGGVVRTIAAELGQTIAVGAVLVVLADTADEPLDGPAEAPADAPVAVSAVGRSNGSAATPSVETPRLRVAPVARRAAAALGVDLARVTGTGPRGRIGLDDVRGAAADGSERPRAAPPELSAPEPSVSASTTADGIRHELTSTRRAIARRMTASQTIPQYHLVRDVDMSHLIAEKAAQASRGPAKVGINDLLVQAIAETAVRHPAIATSYIDGAGDQPPHLLTREVIDVGLAVATDRGLVVPVIRGTQACGLSEIAGERRRLIELARSGRIALSEISGATITLSSLAAAGVDSFTAMVNPGESTIVAVGRTVERLVPRGRTIAIVPTLTLTLTFDHRVVDGAAGAAALAELAGLLEGVMAWRP